MGVAKAEMNCPTTANEYQSRLMRLFSKFVTPECLNRGSISELAWIPAKSMRE